MSKTFYIVIVVCVVALGAFIYFSFANGGKQSDTATQSEPSQAPISQKTDTTGLEIEDLKIGTGSAVKSGDNIVINYVGTLTNGTKFDSSYDRGTPFETQIGVGQVIKGWDLGVVGMKVGGKRKLTIPPNLGYGAQGQGSIPPTPPSSSKLN